MRTGGCHCGAVRYAIEGEPMHHALCHCSDCRRHAGAPMVGWAMFRTEQVKVTTGAPAVYESSDHGRRYFCGRCGTGLLYTNAETLPGITDVQSGTLDEPGDLPAQVHVQIAERIGWMERTHELPMFDRYPAA